MINKSFISSLSRCRERRMSPKSIRSDAYFILICHSSRASDNRDYICTTSFFCNGNHSRCSIILFVIFGQLGNYFLQSRPISGPLNRRNGWCLTPHLNTPTLVNDGGPLLISILINQSPMVLTNQLERFSIFRNLVEAGAGRGLVNPSASILANSGWWFSLFQLPLWSSAT